MGLFTEGKPQARLTAGAVVMAVVCAVLWGGNTVAVKFTVDGGVPPLACAAYRFALCLPVIAVFSLLQGVSLRPGASALTPIFVNGLLLFIQIATFNLGTAWTLAGRASVLINIHPFVVAPLAWWLLGERLRWFGILGLCLAGAGVAWLFQEKLPDIETATAGDAILVFSAFLLGVQTIYQKHALERVRGVTLLFWQTIVAVPLFVLASIFWEGPLPYRFETEAILGLLYQGVGVSGVCFILWFILLQRYPVTQVASIGFLVPLIGVASGMMLRSEPLTLTLAGSTILVGLGIYLVTQARMTSYQVPATRHQTPGHQTPGDQT